MMNNGLVQDFQNTFLVVSGHSAKDRKIQACLRLNMIANGCSSVDEFTTDWQVLVTSLLDAMSMKIGVDIKRHLGETLAAVMTLLPYELGWFVSEVKTRFRMLPRGEEERAILINALWQSTQRAYLRGFPLTDNGLKAEVQFIVRCLENNNSHIVLIALLDAVVQLAPYCAHIFQHHFEEVVDFTIGWLVEPAPASVVEKCQESLLALKPFWAFSTGYAYELIGHFREDIAAYVQDAIEKDDMMILKKSRAVMVTLSTVIGVMIDIGQSEHTEALEVVRQTLASSAVFSTQLENINSHHVAQFFASFCTVFGTTLKLCTFDYAQQLMNDCLAEAIRLTSLYGSNPAARIDFLDFFAKVNAVNEMPLEVTEKLSDDILGEFGFLRDFDFLGSTKPVYASVSRLLASFLSPLSLQQLQKAFLLIKAVMIEDTSTLVCALSNHNICARDVQHAETRFIVFVKSLEKLAMLKNSLVVIMGVKPSLLNVLCTELPVSFPGFSKRFPSAHLAILKVIVSHVQSHDYFLANCEWLSVARGASIGESVTSKHVQLQLQTICKILQEGIGWKQTRELVSNWLTALVSRIDDKSLAQITKKKEWKPLRQAMITAHMKDDVDDGFYEVAKKLGVLEAENEAETVDIMGKVHQKISTISSVKGQKIRSGIKQKLLIRHSVSFKGWDQTETRQQRVPAANFTSADFNMLSDFLLRAIAPSPALNPAEDELWVFDTVDALYFMAEQNRTGERGKPRFIQKWRYALGQMANYCIENRMKTGLGKPMETFNAFGTEVQRLAKEALGMIDRKKTPPETPKIQRKSTKEDEDDDDFGRARPLTDAEEWWRVRCLLEFVEILDKLISNAHTGFVYPIANVSQLSRQFFVQNLASCQEWLYRTYSSAMVVAFHSGSYAQVIRFGSSALIDLERRQLRAEAASREKESSAQGQSPSPEQPAPPSIAYAILGWMGRAMAELGAVQATKGLQEWMKKVYRVDQASWLEGAVDMAAARYEESLVKFNAALRDEGLTDTIKTLIRAMMFDVLNRLRLPHLLDISTCPPEMCIWTEAEALGSTMPKGVDADALTKLKQLCSFAKIEHVVATNPVKWDVSRAVFYKESQFMQTLRRHEMVMVQDETANLGTMVMVGDSGLRSHGRIAVLEAVVAAIVSKMNKVLLSEIELSPSFLASDDKNADIGERLCHARRMSFWAERLQGGCAVHADAAIFARKTGNEMLAIELLNKALATEPPQKQPKIRLISTLQRSKMMWLKADPNERMQAWAEAFAAMSVSLHAENQRQQFMHILNQDTNFQNGGMSNGMSVPPPMPGFPLGLEPIGEEISKTALHLAEWMHSDPTLQINPDIYSTPLWTQLESAAVHTGGDIVGSLLALATNVSPSLAKGHLRLADWAYTMATAGPKEKEMFDNNYRVLLGGEVQQSVLDGLWKALNTSASLGDLEESVNTLLSHDVSGARSIMAFGSHYTNLWSQLVQRRSVFLINAVNSYFSYISQLGSRESSSGSVSATLRILGMLANHADILQAQLEEGIIQTNELLWKDILPQLFSRLSHPNRIVRELILSLLSKLCTSSPHSLVYQVVSGTASFSFVEDSDDVLDDEDEDEDSKKEKGLMFECCRQLEGLLQDMYPSMVRDVREFVTELQKISLLYEEKWTFVLSNLDHEMTKRLEQIKVETARSQNFAHLDEKTRQEVIAEKAKLITSPVYRILDDLYERTCKKKGTERTANEETFVRGFSAELKAAFEQSAANRENPAKAWAPFRDILGILMQKGSRRGAQVFLMDDISTVLAKLHGTCIPLPGQENMDYSDVLTLEKVGGSTQVLPTKTRPKKMMFVGSDGKEHIFLFKGQEDLHLDERIMQLLNICNLMLGKASTKDWPAYSARSYAVTPLGQRSGLIQWVGGATPMFQIYRKWQQKQAQIKSALEKKTGVTVAVPECERPTDIYQKTLRAAFLKHKVAPEVIADRSKWPQPVLKEVLASLMKETPKDLLSRELWARAGSSDTWWRVVCRLARSSAVMSIIGSVLGLGDRHLDNLLVNLDNGQIVHIDYNICFDKGKNLRVPETVPFRLTQNLVHAMGPTQIEGVFRESCRHVMSNLREGREALLTVLDAFVYDPLVDWAAADHLTSSSAAVSVAVALAVYGSDSRVQEAKPIARKMFSVRTKELAVPWMGNCHELSRALDGVRTVLRKQLTMGTSVWDKPETLEQERVEAGRRLKMAIGIHHQMMKDFRPLLRALATCDERFAGLTKRYKELFSEPLIKGHLLLESQPSDLSACVKQFDIVLHNISKIYTDLITIDVSPIVQNGSAAATKERRPSPPPGLEDSLRGGQQEQNAHAKNVVRRVRARLEGRVDETRNVLGVDEQVDSLIRQATSTTLLSLMYEGWTAWV